MSNLLLYRFNFIFSRVDYDAQSFSNPIMEWLLAADCIEVYGMMRRSSSVCTVNCTYWGGPFDCSASLRSATAKCIWINISWGPSTRRSYCRKSSWATSSIVTPNVSKRSLLTKSSHWNSLENTSATICWGKKGVMDEVTVFQPIFRIFLKGCLDALHSKEEDAKHLENFMANCDALEKEKTCVINLIESFLRGRTCVTVSLSNAQNKKPINSICHML